MKRFLLASMTALLCAVCSTALAQVDVEFDDDAPVPLSHVTVQKPTELHLQRSKSSDIDLRNLPQVTVQKFERPEYEEPEPHPVELPGGTAPSAPAAVARPSTPAGAPNITFAGLDSATWGQGIPPDTNGDVGKVYFIQSINSSVGIYNKATGAQVTAFTFNALMAQGAFGNLCDTNNFGDPVVLYDTFEDRWVLTDFAFQLDGTNNVVNPPGAFQCFAVSKTGDPVTGGWNFYSINVAGGLGDYPKLGVWTDGIYMSANMFGYPAGAAFQNPRVFAFNKMQMYAGSPSVQVVTFNAPAADFTVLPSNARLQAGTPPTGTPAYFVSTWQFTNAVGVYKFHVNWNSIGTSTFTGPDSSLAATSWPNAAVANATSPANALDVLQIRAMVQSQYSNIGGAESLWTTHTVRRANTTGFAAPRWYQINVTGGTVAANLPQAATWDPDGANTFHRFVPSLAVNRNGDMALGYSVSNTTTNPSIRYAGRLAADPVNTFSQGEQTLIAGTGTQSGNCGGASCTRWGDYSGMTLDTDGCTFWYTSEYYITNGLNYQTRIGSFNFPGCTLLGGGGTVSGHVTAQAGGAPLVGAAITLGSRTTTTDAAGFYTFTPLPAGTYPSLTASYPGCVTGTASNIVVTDSSTTTQDFALVAAPASGCITNTTQADFQAGVATNVDLNTSPGDVLLSSVPVLDQSNTAGTTTGTGFATTSWGGQTFIPAVTGLLQRVEVTLFCSGCTGTTPNLTLSVRATAGGLPTGPDLATAALSGFSSGSGTAYTIDFPTPATLTSGTQYALILRPVAAPSVGGYFWIRSSPSTYANGQRVISTDNGGTWTADPTRDFNFKTYIFTGYTTSGDLVSTLFDANPAPGKTPIWTTLSWTGSTPANTSLKFQVAASNTATGPFNFVGPDTTAGTFFTSSGASLGQFYNKRYLKYRSYLATTNTASTPVLNDATVCFADQGPPDMSLTKSDGGASVIPGGTVAYTLTYTDAGEQDASGVVLTETVPANSTFNAGASTAGWVCAPNNNAGSTCTLAIGAVTGGGGNGTATFAVTAVNPVAAGVSQLSNTASVADDGTHGADATPANNTASDTTPVDAAPDLTLGKSDGGASVAPGGVVTYTLSYANAGNQSATGVVLTDVVPANTTFNAAASTAGWVCAPNGNAGSTCTFAIGSLAAGANAAVNYAVQVASPISPSITQISNVASVADNGTNGADPTPGNNVASDTTPITGADLSITKTDGATTAPIGGSVNYTITASNAGPNAVSGAKVADTFPASLTCTWTCSGTGSGTCAASGSGSINDSTVNLPVGAGVTYLAQCTVAGNASGSLVNTATVTTPAGVTDPTPANNTATDTDTLVFASDVSVLLNDGHNYVQLGQSLNYVIEVSNTGPATAQVAVTDTLPAQLTGGSWVCSGTAGVTCGNGSGNVLSNNASVPAGGKATYVYSATVGTAGNDLLDNTASASLTGGTDPTPANNSATDHDIVVIFKDGFEGVPLFIANSLGGGSDYVTALLRIDATLAQGLSIVPVEVARGRGADGSLLFVLELSRFGSDLVVRTVTFDAQGMSQRSEWQPIDTGERMLSFAWQSASAHATNGYVSIDGGHAPLLISGRTDEHRLTHLLVTVERQVPWLVVVTH